MNHRHPSCEMLLGPGVKKDSCFHRLTVKSKRGFKNDKDGTVNLEECRNPKSSRPKTSHDPGWRKTVTYQ